MKKFLKYTLIVGFMFLINLSADGKWWKDKGGRGHGGEKAGTTTAPLDGGLLAILAVAGASYYFIRKKKKNKE